MTLSKNSLIRRSKLLLLIIFTLPIAITLNILARLIQPLLSVKFGILRSDRLGHFCVNTELYLLEKESSALTKRTEIHLVSFDLKIANKELKKLWQSRVTLVPRSLIYSTVLLNSVLPDGDKYMAKSTAQDRDVHNLLDQTESTLVLDDEFLRKGETILAELGVPSGAKFVCLVIRDSAYLQSVFPDQDFSYHDYRDSDPSTYLGACEWLASLGIYTLRMGATVGTKFSHDSELIIDYANSSIRSDFMDIYLGANCLFCISQGTGFDGIPMIFRRPIAYANIAPIFYFNTPLSKSIGIFKYHRDKKTGECLSLEEILYRGLGECMTSDCFTAKNIQLEDNTSEDITELVKEMWIRLNSTETEFFSTLENDQKKFRNIFNEYRRFSCDSVRIHGELKARVATSYLKNNRYFLNQKVLETEDHHD